MSIGLVLQEQKTQYSHITLNSGYFIVSREYIVIFCAPKYNPTQKVTTGRKNFLFKLNGRVFWWSSNRCWAVATRFGETCYRLQSKLSRFGQNQNFYNLQRSVAHLSQSELPQRPNACVGPFDYCSNHHTHISKEIRRVDHVTRCWFREKADLWQTLKQTTA